MSVRINFIQRKSFRERVWKTLNVVVGITTLLNVSMVGALITPQAANAKVGGIDETPVSTQTSASMAVDSTATTTTPTPVPNPVLGQSCGLDIGLVIDRSGSVDNTEMGQMKTALKSFVDAFAGTPTQFSVTKFDTTASVVQNFTDNLTTTKNTIDSVSTGGNTTNWEDGLAKGYSTFDPRTDKSNLIVIATDGSPNTYNTSGGTAFDWTQGLHHAITEANTIKTASGTTKSRIVALGIGSDPTDPDYPNTNFKLQDISGPTLATTPATITTSTDVIKVTDFTGIGAALASYAKALCGGKILVQKQFDTNGDNIADVKSNDPLLSGYNFTTNATTKTTDNTGSLQFDNVLNGNNYSVVETPKAGTKLVSASCINGTQAVGSVNLTTGTVSGLTMGTDQTISCTFVNAPTTGSLKVIKHVVGGTATAGSWQLHVKQNGNDVTASPQAGNEIGTNYTLTSGSYVISETGPSGYTPSFSASCPNGVINVIAGQVATCTLMNTLSPVYTLGLTKVVNKGTALPGDSLTYTLTYRNNGNSPLTNVKITETYDGRFAFGNSTPTPSTGNTVWNIGTLAAGASGTISITGTLASIFPEGTTTVHNIAVASSNETTNQTATADTLVSASCHLVVTKNVNTTTATGGDILTYTINYVNTGKAFCTGGGVILYDTLGTGLTYVTNSAKIVSVANDQDLHAGDSAPEVFPATFNGTNNTTLGNLHEIGPNESGVVELKATTSTGTECTNWTVQNTGRTDGVEVGSKVSFSSPITNINAICTTTIKVIKHVINDNGGAKVAGNFSVHITGTAGTVNFAGSEQGITSTVVPGTYVVTETPDPAYTSSMAGSCSGTITLGQHLICTITNDDKPGTLIVKKHVVNDNGGTKSAGNFTMSVTGTNVSTPTFAGTEDGSIVTLNAGSYSVDELAMTGYAKTLGANCSGSIANGETKTCVITNDDIQPTLTVTKIVNNAFGGTAVSSNFTLHVAGTNVSPSSFPGSAAGTPVLLNSGTFNVTEDLVSGYSPVYSSDCTGSISIGEHKTCIVTNSAQQPMLLVIKKVINNNNGNNAASSFTMNVTGTNATPSSFPGSEIGTYVTLNVGSYSVDEGNHDGYTKTLSADCTGTIALGQTKTCTITNDDIEPTITLVKSVTNNNGGTAGPNDFGLTIGGTSVASGQILSVNANAAYALNEAGKTGYSFVSLTGTGCPSQLGGTVTLNEGQNITCTITNDDLAATITVIKHVINNNGGNNTAGDFTMHITGTAATTSFAGQDNPGTTTTVVPGSFVITESGPSGYHADYAGDCTSTIALGEHKTCTIANDDIAPTITLVKSVTNNNGGTASPNDFGLTIGGTSVASGQILSVNANATYALNEAGKTGYSFVSLTGTGCPSQLGGTVTLNEGQNITCTITNDDQPGTLIVKKILPNDNGGTAKPEQFSFSVNHDTAVAFEADGQNDLTVPAGTYSVVETNPMTGYAASYDNCSNIVIPNGGTATCIITNNDIQPKLTVTKVVINDNGGTKVVTDFPLFVGKASVTSGAQNGFDAGTYTISETNQAGYTGTISGNCASDGSITLNPGDVKSCTITNDDQAPTLTLIKHVMNDNGGTAENTDWVLSANGPTQIAGSSPVVSGPTFKAGTYTLAETNGPSGYAASAWVCNERTLEGNQVSLTNGQSMICEITNDDIVPKIIVVKHVINNGGGSKVASDFTMHVEAAKDFTSSFPGNEQGTTVTVGQGAYNITETQLTGYTASLSADCVGTIKVGETKTCTITNDDVVSDINLVKTASPAIVVAGGNITYTLAWSVTGVNHVTNAIVTDAIPANTTFVTADCGTTTGTCTMSSVAGTVTWSLGTRNAGDTGTVTMVVKSTSPITNGTIITNAGMFDTTETPPVTSTAKTPVTSAPILSITKTNDVIGFTNPGKLANYTVTVTNASTATDTAKNVVMIDTLPTGFTFVDSGLATKTLTVGDLAPGASKAFVLPVNISATQTVGTYTNTASAKGDNTTSVSATSPIEIRVPSVLGVTAEPSLVLTKTASTKSAPAGSTLTYTVKISNAGDIDLTNVKLTDTLPKGFTFFDTGKATKSWTIGTLAAHHERVINYVVKVGANVTSGAYVNTATVTSNELTPQSAHATVKVPQVLGLATTGVSLKDYVLFAFGLSLMSLGVYWIGRMRRQNHDVTAI